MLRTVRWKQRFLPSLKRIIRTSRNPLLFLMMVSRLPITSLSNCPLIISWYNLFPTCRNETIHFMQITSHRKPFYSNCNPNFFVSFSRNGFHHGQHGYPILVERLRLPVLLHKRQHMFHLLPRRNFSFESFCFLPFQSVFFIFPETIVGRKFGEILEYWTVASIGYQSFVRYRVLLLVMFIQVTLSHFSNIELCFLKPPYLSICSLKDHGNVDGKYIGLKLKETMLLCTIYSKRTCIIRIATCKFSFPTHSSSSSCLNNMLIDDP